MGCGTMTPVAHPAMAVRGMFSSYSASSPSAKQTCEALLQDALDGGGTDNITIVVGRMPPDPGIAF